MSNSSAATPNPKSQDTAELERHIAIEVGIVHEASGSGRDATKLSTRYIMHLIAVHDQERRDAVLARKVAININNNTNPIFQAFVAVDAITSIYGTEEGES